MNMGLVKAFFRFLISKLFLINLALVILVGFMIPYCSLGALEDFTNNDISSQEVIERIQVFSNEFSTIGNKLIT